MKIEYCNFPDNLQYSLEHFVWVDVEEYFANKNKDVTVGITPIIASMAGKFTRIKVKPTGTIINKDNSIATIESLKYFGVVRSPIAGKIVAINDNLYLNPKLANDRPYDNGWFVRIEPSDMTEKTLDLKSIKDSEGEIRKLIASLRIRCFAAFPDYELFQIGVECSTTLAKLDELVPQVKLNDIIHVVSDDQTADIELVRWSEEREQSIIEIRRENNLFHIIIKKIKS